mmetsp:Transcript_16986/g.22245  ORF Transcript_16986/g.22245 Transcript_16986/m.22245 type:complete len:415 (-) Transcript_16986:880-2124(-)|eukprot:CAMPEP_0184023152 /NCGR_PEP_ID=MMETSP0954-20121128/11152_1 /TAXON_ID=627963 /ORGANISM="Aplanochytrium sp, Strain PBS07" /LENGTH=414 /DNA_ID=CAMNT_0026305905 /DNA_START=63 /DNA_END=1307 /DNA_ORIENTATION=-
MISSKDSKVGYVYDEKYSWFDSGPLHIENLQPVEHWENVDTKRRIHSLLLVSGIYEKLLHLKARDATREELLLFHTPEYVDKVQALSSGEGGKVGDEAYVCKMSYEIAARSAGGVLSAVEAVLEGRVKSCYCLCRPPGHHALSNEGMGFCVFNNIVIGALHAKNIYSRHRGEDNCRPRIAIVDYDVHHGNGTESAFEDDDEVLFISLHQDNNYPLNEGGIRNDGSSTTINVPLPPGSGSGAYRYAMRKIVVPAVENFRPDIILVSSGFDASYMDPLSCMMLSSEDFKFIASSLLSLASKFCEGRIIFVHEGGYSKHYTPFCAVGVFQAMLETGTSEKLSSIDPFLEEVNNWGYQNAQAHQERVVDEIARKHCLSQASDASGVIRKKVKSMLAQLSKQESLSILQSLTSDLERGD